MDCLSGCDTGDRGLEEHQGEDHRHSHMGGEVAETELVLY